MPIAHYAQRFTFATDEKALRFYAAIKACNLRGVSNIDLQREVVRFEFNDRATFATRNAVYGIRREVEAR